MTITEKVAYLKGLMEGLDIDKTTKEGKLFGAMADILEDLALTAADDSERIDAIDEDLADLEEYVYDGDYDDGIDLDDEYCPGNCDGCDGCDDFDYDTSEYEFECPSCHEVVFIDESVFEEGKEIECPSCGAKLEGFYEEEEDTDE